MPKMTPIPHGFELCEDYEVRGFVIPKGFQFDGASVPSFLQWIINDFGKQTVPALLHDYLYRFHKVSRKEADDLFYDMLIEYGYNKFKSKLAWLAVRAFGVNYWMPDPNNGGM